MVYYHWLGAEAEAYCAHCKDGLPIEEAKQIRL